jgi:IMP dehydrogenase
MKMMMNPMTRMITVSDFYKPTVNIGSLDYKDVFLVPQYSEVTSRSQVDTSVHIGDFKIDVPVISANMDTVTAGEMAHAMAEGGAIGAIHRFMTVEQNIHEFQIGTGEKSHPCFVSIGVNEESKDRARKLYNAGARNFVIDIAHGHSRMMRDMTTWLRETYSDVYVMAGNVATAQAVKDLASWGAHAIKVGIGPGNVCTTKNVTGVTVPQFSAVMECATVLHGMYGNKPLIVADGGITEIGDIAKALAAGADLVMCGRLFASAREAPGERVGGKKVYRGMASRDAMLNIRNASSLPTAEGVSTLIDASEHSAIDIVNQIKGGLQSSFSYSNARNLCEFQMNAKFGVRHTQMK